MNSWAESLGVMNAREVYGDIESLVAFDYHYWLQRGSLEVQQGDLTVATQYLDQARSLSPNDYLVQTAYGDLQMRKASEHPDRRHAGDYLEEGMAILESVITERGRITPYPFPCVGHSKSAMVPCGCNHDRGREARVSKRDTRAREGGS